MKQTATTLYLIRHAEADRTLPAGPERPLSEKGQADSRMLAANLYGFGIAQVYASPSRCAIETVEPLAASQGVEVQIEPDVRERSAANAFLEEFDAFKRRQWMDFAYKMEGGEALCEVQARCVAAIKAIGQRCPGQAVAICTHGTALGTVLRYMDEGYSYSDHLALVPKTPWVVRCIFDGETLAMEEQFDPLRGRVNL